MAVLELYGKCRELGYCDCNGFFGCLDGDGPKRAPKDEEELRNAMRGEASVADYKNYNLKRELEKPQQSQCEVCGKQKRSTTTAKDLTLPEPTCGHCGKKARRNHKCAAKDRAETAAVERILGKPTAAYSVEPDLLKVVEPKDHHRSDPVPVPELLRGLTEASEDRHKVVIELSGMRITIEPVE